MFKDSKAFASYSIDDVAKAKAFYGDVLGIDVAEVPGMEDLLDLHLSAGNKVMLYAKPDHQPATFTVLNFPVEDVDKAVERLKGSGVRFEKYDTEDIKTDAKGVFRDEGMAIAWFKDPAGNILSVMSGKVVEREAEFAGARSAGA